MTPLWFWEHHVTWQENWFMIAREFWPITLGGAI
jgi:hypothetical protein